MKAFRNSTPFGRVSRTLLMSSFILLLVIFGFVIRSDEIKASAQLYVFAYPLVLMDVTREAFVEGVGPENVLFHGDSLPTADFREVVRPNLDTLYSSAWLNLEETPMVLSLPDDGDRYFLLTIIDAWTNVIAAIGSRQNTPAGSEFLLVGPDWDGEPPEGLSLIRCPTNMNWLLGRIQVKGAKDLPAVQRQQKAIDLVSLDRWLSKDATTEDMSIVLKPTSKRSPMFQVEEMSAQQFASRFLKLQEKNPVYERDKTHVDSFIDTIADPRQWGFFQAASMSAGMKLAKFKLKQAIRSSNTKEGWAMPPLELGDYGVNYPMRAVVSMVGLGANLPEDAVYPSARNDHQGELLSDDSAYVIHFEAEALPPVNAFWSITLYDEDGYLVPNDLSRHVIGSSDRLLFNEDGSLDIYIQRDQPIQVGIDNWLPTGEVGIFNLTARLYWPKDEVLQLEWEMPPIKKIMRP